MVTIKLHIDYIIQSIGDYINKVLKSDICLFNSNYSELYIKPSVTDLYIKVKKGKKYQYKKIKYFSIVDYYNEANIDITLDNYEKNNCKLNLDFEVMIEQDYNKED